MAIYESSRFTNVSCVYYTYLKKISSVPQTTLKRPLSRKRDFWNYVTVAGNGRYAYFKKLNLKKFQGDTKESIMEPDLWTLPHPTSPGSQEWTSSLRFYFLPGIPSFRRKISKWIRIFTIFNALGSDKNSVLWESHTTEARIDESVGLRNSRSDRL